MSDEFDDRNSHSTNARARGCESERGAGARAGRHRERRRHHSHRKERVLHTRISEPLAEDIRRVAEDLRVPVSNLVRNVLEEAFAVVETVSENVGDLIEEVVEEAERTRDRIRRRSERNRRADARVESMADGSPPAPRAEHPEVLGWQPLIFNRPQVCADCEEPIDRGERGYVGVVASGLSDIHLCRDCIAARH